MRSFVLTRWTFSGFLLLCYVSAESRLYLIFFIKLQVQTLSEVEKNQTIKSRKLLDIKKREKQRVQGTLDKFFVLPFLNVL